MRKLRSTALTAAAGTLAADPIDVTGDASGLTVGVEVPVVGPVNVGPLPVANTPPGESEQVLSVSEPGVVDTGVLTAAASPPPMA